MPPEVLLTGMTAGQAAATAVLETRTITTDFLVADLVVAEATLIPELDLKISLT